MPEENWAQHRGKKERSPSTITEEMEKKWQTLS